MNVFALGCFALLVRQFRLSTAIVGFVLIVGCAPFALADGSVDNSSAISLSDRSKIDLSLQSLKKDAIDLASDIFSLRESVLSPLANQLVIFLSVDMSDVFSLDSVQLRIDGDEIIKKIYSVKGSEALLGGGTQRAYLGRLNDGNHKLLAIFIGHGLHGRAYRRAVQLSFKKTSEPKYIELKITDQKTPGLPQFELKDWQ